MIATKVSDSSRIANIIVILFCCIPLVGYVSGYVPNAIAQGLLYALIYICFAIYFPKSHRLNYKYQLYWISLCVYLILLGFRLFYDFIYEGQQLFIFGSNYTIAFVYIFQICLPAILLHKFKLNINERLIGLIISAVLSICMILSINKIMHGDVEVSNDGRFDNGYGIFAIEFGHYAVSLIIIGCCLFSKFSQIIVKIFLVICILSGVAGCAFAGSRSPVMALIICLAFYIVARSKNIKKLLRWLLLLLVISPIIFYMIDEFAEIFSSWGFNSFDRIYDSFFGDDSITSKTSGRDVLYEEALGYFAKSPIVGYSFLIPGKIYVHNVFIEAFIGMGFLGGISFMVFNMIGLHTALKMIGKKADSSYVFIPLLYVQYLVFGFFSSTIINLPLYWLYMLLTMNLAKSPVPVASRLGKWVETNK